MDEINSRDFVSTDVALCVADMFFVQTLRDSVLACTGSLLEKTAMVVGELLIPWLHEKLKDTTLTDDLLLFTNDGKLKKSFFQFPHIPNGVNSTDEHDMALLTLKLESLFHSMVAKERDFVFHAARYEFIGSKLDTRSLFIELQTRLRRLLLSLLEPLPEVRELIDGFATMKVNRFWEIVECPKLSQATKAEPGDTSRFFQYPSCSLSAPEEGELAEFNSCFEKLADELKECLENDLGATCLESLRLFFKLPFSYLPRGTKTNFPLNFERDIKQLTLFLLAPEKAFADPLQMYVSFCGVYDICLIGVLINAKKELCTKLESFSFDVQRKIVKASENSVISAVHSKGEDIRKVIELSSSIDADSNQPKKIKEVVSHYLIFEKVVSELESLTTPEMRTAHLNSQMEKRRICSDRRNPYMQNGKQVIPLDRIFEHSVAAALHTRHNLLRTLKSGTVCVAKNDGFEAKNHTRVEMVQDETDETSDLSNEAHREVHCGNGSVDDSAPLIVDGPLTETEKSFLDAAEGDFLLTLCAQRRKSKLMEEKAARQDAIQAAFKLASARHSQTDFLSQNPQVTSEKNNRTQSFRASCFPLLRSKLDPLSLNDTFLFFQDLKAGDKIVFSHRTSPFGPIKTTVLEILEGGLAMNDKPVKLQHDQFNHLLTADFEFKITETLVDGAYEQLPDFYSNGMMRLRRSLESYNLVTSKGHLPLHFQEVLPLFFFLFC